MPSKPLESTEVGKVDFKKSENKTSEGREKRLQEVDESDTIDNYTNYNESNNTDKNYNDVSENNHIISNRAVRADAITKDMNDTQRRLMDEMAVTTWLIKNNISYDNLIAAYPLEKKRIDEMVEIIVDVIVSNSDTVRIEKEDKPLELVRSRFEKLDYSSMEYVLECLKHNTTKVHCIKNYLLTTLYNASLTIDNYYAAEVNHDMYGIK